MFAFCEFCYWLGINHSVYHSLYQSLQTLNISLSRSSFFSCVRDVPHTTQDCSNTLLQNMGKFPMSIFSFSSGCFLQEEAIDPDWTQMTQIDPAWPNLTLLDPVVPVGPWLTFDPVWPRSPHFLCLSTTICPSNCPSISLSVCQSIYNKFVCLFVCSLWGLPICLSIHLTIFDSPECAYRCYCWDMTFCWCHLRDDMKMQRQGPPLAWAELLTLKLLLVNESQLINASLLSFPPPLPWYIGEAWWVYPTREQEDSQGW